MLPPTILKHQLGVLRLNSSLPLSPIMSGEGFCPVRLPASPARFRCQLQVQGVARACDPVAAAQRFHTPLLGFN